MSSWNAAVYDASGELEAYLRLGTYQSSEENDAPSQYPGTFSDSDGIFMTTTGDFFLNAGQAIDVEFEDDAEVVLGNFASQSDVALKLDVTAGDGYAAFKGGGVAINAVSSADDAKAAEDGKLILFASDGITTNSTDDTRFHSDGDVYIQNDTESNCSTQSKSLMLGSATSVVMFAETDITAGFAIVAIPGIRTSVALYTSETLGVKFGYSRMSNEIALASAENKGLGAYLKNISGLIGVLMQEEELTEVEQEEFENGVTAGKVVNRLVGTKSGSVEAQGGIQNTM
ncbi:hypothetical protein [Amorphus orientalis]|uniref:Uncharacterized protein n=1 Tax=Amorphus orientalis TaxID=649198 RepID=A0AAE3VSL8_9HYPH|nr:hypothetical protein [Amorphus orientalis]MDQ0317423.1 hypothetical protein [Amorphus orientalis]